MTAIDGAPTIQERLRISWLRLFGRTQVQGTQGRKAAQLAYNGVGFVAKIGLIALMRPWGILVLALLLLVLGYSLPELLRKGISLQ